MWRALLFLMSSVPVMWCSSAPCTEEEHRAMQTEFSECRSNFNRDFHAREYNDDDLCKLLDQIINICAKKWQQCHSQQEIRKMKEMHTEAFIHHWERDSNIESCQTVKLFRESLLMRSEESKAAGAGEPDCTDQESSDSMARFSSCSHATSTHIYTSISDSTPAATITDMLCTGLTNISSACPIHLRPCFAAEDVEEIRLQHIREMRKFFNRLMKDRIPSNALDKCGEKKYVVPTTTTTTTSTTTTTTTTTTSNLDDMEMFKNVHEINRNDLLNIDDDETNDIERYEAQLDHNNNNLLDTKSVRSSNRQVDDAVEEYPNDPQPKTSTKSVGNESNSRVKVSVSGLVLSIAVIPILLRL